MQFVLVAFGLFLLLEMSARVYLFGFAGLLPERVNSIRGLPQTGFTQPAPADSGRVFELRPNLDGYFKLVPFRTNSVGLRDREYDLRKPENTFRVAVLGSSFAFPAGVAIEQAFHSVLEERLSAEFAPRRFEFINFSVGMYNPVQVLAMLETRALPYEPDLILFTATALAMPWLTGEYAPPPREESPVAKPPVRDRFQKSYPVLQSFFVRLLLQRLGQTPDTPQTHVGVLEQLYMNAVRHWTRPPSNSGRKAADADSAAAPIPKPPDHKHVLESLARIQRRTGIPIVIVRLEFDPTEKSATDIKAQKRAQALGIRYLDTRDAFVGTRPSDFWIFELDPHPDGRAHEIFAEVIARFLDSNNLLPD